MDFYTIMSSVYDILDVTYFRNKAKDPRAAINTMIYGDDIKVVDMCCGTLANTIPAAKSHKNAKFLGIDISEKMLRIAKLKLKLNNLKNVRIKCLDSTETHIKSDCMDYVVIGLALHEMKPYLQQKILKEARRILKPDGRLIVLEWERPKNIVQVLLFFPLLITEQILNSTFFKFYCCDKNTFFKEHGFEMSNTIHCSYSAVMEFKKSEVVKDMNSFSVKDNGFHGKLFKLEKDLSNKSYWQRLAKIYAPLMESDKKFMRVYVKL